MTFSPYALLQSSRPKPPQTITTHYDLYSLSGQSSVRDTPVQEPLPASPEQAITPPAAKRTHYIADIHARHTGAMRQARQLSLPLSSATIPSSSQLP